MTFRRPHILLLDGHRKRPFYANVVAALDADWDEASPAEVLSGPAGGIDLVVVDDETWPYTAGAICACRTARVPTLHLVDGILEWTNVWENPRQATEHDGMPLLQPVLSDKVACLGRSQARLIESWGNPGRCEVTGSPRFDGLAPVVREPRGGGPFRLLVATARTPAFTPYRREQVVARLRDLKEWLGANRRIGGRQLVTTWRLTAGLDVDVGVQNEGGRPLADQLHAADALITTPSTLQVEGMLAGIPVALLQAVNVPHFVPAAWTISAREHLAEIVPGLTAPEPHRMLHQQTILHDSVECRGPSAPRVARLAERMIEIGRECRRAGHPLELPARLLPEASPPHEPFPFERMHPGHPIFQQRDLLALQAEVAQLRRIVRRSPWQRLHWLASMLQRRFAAGRPGSAL